MAFATQYLDKQHIRLIDTAPDKSLSGAVVIPCCNEPDIAQTLQSLFDCDKPRGLVEIIVVINHRQQSPEIIKKQNRATYNELGQLSKKVNTGNIKLHPLWLGEVTAKHAGAGYARKIGMDEAIRRFNDIDKPNNYIVSLDADTTVMANYLTEIERIFTRNPQTRQIVIPFVHRKNDIDTDMLSAITLYELYLRYYRLALETIDWLWPYYTLGSAFAVRASVYVEQQGMNRRQAGEDFYFLNKLFPLGGTAVADKTMVYPSARLSSRVPFGTGPALKQIIENNFRYNVYNLQAITDLKYFTKNSTTLFKATQSEIDEYIDQAPAALKSYWKTINFAEKIGECNIKSATVEPFIKRLYRNFDAFQVVKYLNFAHLSFYEKGDIRDEFEHLLLLLRDNSSKYSEVLLQNAGSVQLADRAQRLLAMAGIIEGVASFP